MKHEIRPENAHGLQSGAASADCSPARGSVAGDIYRMTLDQLHREEKWAHEYKKEIRRLIQKRNRGFVRVEPNCPCGFKGTTGNIRQHRMQCPAWNNRIEIQMPPND